MWVKPNIIWVYDSSQFPSSACLWLVSIKVDGLSVHLAWLSLSILSSYYGPFPKKLVSEWTLCGPNFRYNNILNLLLSRKQNLAFHAMDYVHLR